MDTTTIVLLVIGGLVVLTGLYVWSTYNGLVTLNVRVDEAWSDITVQLKRRADLIPNLIETVKGYAKHEKEVFENVTAARAATTSANTPAEAAAAEGMMQSALKSIFAVAEAYPDLQASQNFQQLQAELVDTENKICTDTQARALFSGYNEIFDMNTLSSISSFEKLSSLSATFSFFAPMNNTKGMIYFAWHNFKQQ